MITPINKEDGAALDQLWRSGMPGIDVTKRVITENLLDLIDVRNIDPKGNMGLQALARQEAAKKLQEIFEQLGWMKADELTKAKNRDISDWR